MSVIISCLSGYCTPVRATIGRFYLLLLVVAFLFRTFKCECVWVRIAYEQRILLLFRHHFQQCFFSAVFIFLPIIFVCVCCAGVHYSGLSHPLCTTCTPFSVKILSLYGLMAFVVCCPYFVFNIILNRAGAIMFKYELIFVFSSTRTLFNSFLMGSYN